MIEFVSCNHHHLSSEATLSDQSALTEFILPVYEDVSRAPSEDLSLVILKAFADQHVNGQHTERIVLMIGSKCMFAK